MQEHVSREGIVRVAEEGYLRMTDRGLAESPGQMAMACVRVALNQLCKLRRSEGDAAVYETIIEIGRAADGRALVTLTAQAIRVLDEQGWRLPTADDEDEE